MCTRWLRHGESVSVIHFLCCEVARCEYQYFSCHLGLSIIYDTVTELSWAVDIRTHGIVNVIENVLNKTWAPSEAEGRAVPVAKSDRKSTRLNSSHSGESRMPSSA